MGRKKKSETDGLLTPLELEVMTILWKRGEGSVHDVLEELPAEEYAYTTISTILRLLLAKEVVSAKSQGRQHTYVPLLQKSDYETRSVSHVVETVFDGEAGSLIRRMISDKALSAKDLDEIQTLLDKRKRK